MDLSVMTRRPWPGTMMCSRLEIVRIARGLITGRWVGPLRAEEMPWLEKGEDKLPLVNGWPVVGR
eukprot:10891085-Karenia_brevis.AAC.1